MGIELVVTVKRIDKTGTPVDGNVQIYFCDLDIADYSGVSNSAYYPSNGPWVYGQPTYYGTFMEGVWP